MYKLKQVPEDFVVKEVSSFKTEALNQEQGKYLFFKLTKKNYNTLDAIKTLAKILNLREKQIGFAGTKDRNAVTEQVCSVPSTRVSKTKLQNIKLKDIQIEFLGYGNEPITLGDLQANYFEITIRNLDNDTQLSNKETNYFANYFDEQRFSKNNVQVGRHLIKKEFKEAYTILRKDQNLPEVNNNDYIGAIKRLPIRLLRLYVNAYQSYLWNETLANFLKQNDEKDRIEKEINYSQGTLVFTKNPEQFKDLQIPLIGFASDDLTTNQEINKITNSIMQKENISEQDFIIKQIPELSQGGELRNAFTEIQNLTISKLEPDELNENKAKIHPEFSVIPDRNKNKLKLTFTLTKGSYATMVIKKLIA